MIERAEPRRFLVTGATGYVGGRLVHALEERNARLRCLARHPEALGGWVQENTEVMKGDLLDPSSLGPAFEDIDVAYYLVHALGAGEDFEEQEATAAWNFRKAAEEAGVGRIVYLGGLVHESGARSPHMRSRLRVGEILRGSGIPAMELRSSVIIGSGSLSFELVRTLVRRLPVMITPKWVYVDAQPIAIEDVIEYLLAAADIEAAGSKVYEIGGADRMSYLDLMRTYAQVRGLHRFFIPVPLLTPGLSSLWLGLVTPLFVRVGRRLIDSITEPSVVEDLAALHDFSIRPMGVREAIERAMSNEDEECARTHWSGAQSSMEPKAKGKVFHYKNRIVESRTVEAPVDADYAFAPIRRIGGRTGWYYANGLWRLRGWLDRAIGGVGMKRGRRDPEDLRVGDVVDCWRVQAYDPPHRLLLAAEMKMPGRAWLQFEVTEEDGRSTIRQTALFDPRGWGGLLYWYLLLPPHRIIFAGMLKRIAREAVRGASPRETQGRSGEQPVRPQAND